MRPLPHDEWADELKGAQLVGQRWLPARRATPAAAFIIGGLALAAAALLLAILLRSHP